MKTIVYAEYGHPDVLRLEDVEKLNPNDNLKSISLLYFFTEIIKKLSELL
ncbi:MAG: hypothetical protein ACFFC1_00920 [Promethearchaeota archaeon]